MYRRKTMRKKRNLIAKDLLTNPLYRMKVSKTVFEREKKLDKWDKKAKHKPSKNDFLDGLFFAQYTVLTC